MRKIFTLIVTLLGIFSVNAAEITLCHGNTPLADGASYLVGYEGTEIVPGSGFFRYEWDADLLIQADPAIEITVTIESNYAGTAFCGFDGLCVNPTDGKTSKTGHTTSAQPESLRIDYVCPPGGTMISNDNVVKVTAYPTANPAAAVTATVVMTNLPASEVGSVPTVEAAPQVPAFSHWYSISGVETKASDLQKGRIYLRRTNGHTEKVTVK